ncbi:hypothetical protein ACIOD2_35680 [Amycolatopsis sp. NPDC088138]|uniref:hypothetical protein n=1 Tax=Amycolatopsis sp. NPDC088138 TaxID=3363938 RepID=UPI003819D2C0
MPRVGTGDNLTWTSLVRYLAFPCRTAGRHDEAAGDGRQVAVDLLFALLDEFLEQRSAAIFDEYLTWRRAQSWYRG